MAIGNAVTVAPVSLTAGASTDIKPTGTTEWVIHNIYVPTGKTFTLYRGNGTNWITIDTITGSLLSFAFHCTSTNYLRLYNADDETLYVSYDGIITY